MKSYTQLIYEYRKRLYADLRDSCHDSEKASLITDLLDALDVHDDGTEPFNV